MKLSLSVANHKKIGEIDYRIHIEDLLTMKYKLNSAVARRFNILYNVCVVGDGLRPEKETT